MKFLTLKYRLKEESFKKNVYGLAVVTRAWEIMLRLTLLWEN